MKQFEDLPVWQAGRELVRKVYAAARVRPFAEDAGLRDQIQRAAVSITSNIAEGHERSSTPDLIQFLFYAKGSAGEVRSQLYHAEDVGYLSADKAQALRAECLDVSRQLSAWIQSMQTPGFKRGPKYHKEPDTAWEQFAAKAGLQRQPNGSYKKVKESRGRYGSGREDGRS
ncbi:MAG TPA: four helix bundle protein [Kiritimatiellia bacterium]|nr:four helix bundle protein [Kiritimatiellia bacterium]HMP33873.1 four helix bundle protein [Kiritimatiellia bacterium]